MPTISAFYGIVIRMYYDDHAPPHFHAVYGDHEAQVNLETLEVIEGSVPKRVMAMILEWALAHRDEIRRDWQLAGEHQPLRHIEPLE